jgi:hypothetical protein
LADDPSRHVHELRIQHQKLTHVRKNWGGGLTLCRTSCAGRAPADN